MAISRIHARLSRDSFFRMGYYYQAKGDLDSAAHCYMRSIETHPSAEAHTFLGWVLNLMGETEHAIEECKKAIHLDPTFGNAWNDVGVYLVEKRQWKEAVRCFKRASKVKEYDHPEFPHYNLARLYIQQELLKRAKSELKQALNLNSNFKAAKELAESLERLMH